MSAKKIYILIAFILLFPTTTHADIRAQYDGITADTDDTHALAYITDVAGTICGDTSGTGHGSQYLLFLGKNIAGTPDALQLRIENNTAFPVNDTTRKFRACVWESDANSTYLTATSTPTGKYVEFAFTFPESMSPTYITSATTTLGGGFTEFDPTMNYTIGFKNTNSQVGLFWGTDDATENLYQDFHYTCTDYDSTCSATMEAPYFVLRTTAGTDLPSYVSSFTPAHGSTAPNTTVELTMNYHAEAENNINSYSFIITDQVVASSTIRITGGAYTGDNTVNDTVELTTGHIYSMTAYICSAEGTCFSGLPSHSFSVVSDFTTTYGSIFNGYGGFLASSTPTCTPASSILDVGGGLTYGLCVMFVPSSNVLNQYANIPTVIASKFPFSYISGLSEVLDALTSQASSTTAKAYFTFPLGATFTNPSNGNASTTFDMFNPSSIVSNVPLVTTMRTYMSYILYFMFGLFAFRRVMKLI